MRRFYYGYQAGQRAPHLRAQFGTAARLQKTTGC
jgi:hypothetical protein